MAATPLRLALGLAHGKIRNRVTETFQGQFVSEDGTDVCRQLVRKEAPTVAARKGSTTLGERDSA